MAAPNPERESLPHVSLRSAQPDDREFLLRVYASTREPEMLSWGWPAAEQSRFIQMQFDARARGYAVSYPAAAESVVLANDEPAGSILVLRAPQELRLVDIALLPQFRNLGITSALLGALIAESVHKKIPLRLSVVKGNRAARLYERLGFFLKSEDAMYCEMEHAAQGN
jgi:ribosomal protein S18 acetylase RimI-like enzyme